ncbi:MAG TPA: cbb3-type cytochrome c oxidase subunit I, partial [Myxococcales bacterium]|nr:cbb3-type cytochrome c oxidase subunit I [Myxococcales bacterium]
VYYWYPKATGRQMNPLLGKLHFWFSFVCINFIFMPMFFQGMAGLSRRLYDPTIYAHGRGVQALNVLISWSAWGLAIAQLPFIINFFMSLRAGARVAENPWHATTIEWAATSPPGHGNFLTEPVAYREPYEYSVPGKSNDYSPQFQAEG